MKLKNYQLGQGTWLMAEDPNKFSEEYEALSCGITNGLTLIDTAEMYGDGSAEKLVGKVIKPFQRDSLYLVSKVYPHNASMKGMKTACQNSLKRLGVSYLDLYLLHWRGEIPLGETVAAFEQLKQEGYIREWGVSNFDVADMEELWKIPDGNQCVTNQVLYHIASRGIEYDLIPWLKKHDVTLMAYSPLAHNDTYQNKITENRVLLDIAAEHHVSIYQVMLAFVIRHQDTIALPRASSKKHVLDNIGSLKLKLTEEDMKRIDEAFPAPKSKIALDVL